MADDFESEARKRAVRAAQEGDTEAAIDYLRAADRADSQSGGSSSGEPPSTWELLVFFLTFGAVATVLAVALFVTAIGSVFAGIVAAPWYIPFGLAFPEATPLQTAYWDAALVVHFWTGCGLFAWVVIKRFSDRTPPLSSVYHGRVDALDGLSLGAGIGVAVASFCLFTATGPLGVAVPVGWALPLVGGAAVACSLVGGVLGYVVSIESLVRSRLFPLWRSTLLLAVSLFLASLYTNAVVEGLINPPYALGSGGALTALAAVVAGAAPGLAVFLREPVARLGRDGLVVIGVAAVVRAPSDVPGLALLVAVVGAVIVLTADLRVRYRGTQSALSTLTVLWGRTTG
jgi:hypothetical protein